jgi:hypothetical protein
MLKLVLQSKILPNSQISHWKSSWVDLSEEKHSAVVLCFPSVFFFVCVSICEMFLAGASGIMLIYFWCRNVLFYKYFEHRICNSENCMEYIKIADLGIKQMWSGIFWNVKIVIVKSVVEKHKEKVLTHFLA